VALTACDPGPALPEIRQLRVRRLSRGLSARPWPIVLEGKGLVTSAAHPLRLELLRVEPPWPRVRVALQGLQLEPPHRVRAEVPAGTPPGRYRLVAYRGGRWVLERHRIRVRASQANNDAAKLSGLWTRRPGEHQGGRLVITGSNLGGPVRVSLHGPQIGRAHV